MKELVYLTIQKYLMELIEKNKYQEGYLLPSEAQLCQKFGASRVSVRKALDMLEKRNFITKIQGKGTFINSKMNVYPLAANKLDENICLIVPNAISNFVNQIITGVSDYCDKYHYNLIIMYSNDNVKTETGHIQNCLKLNCKGLMIFPANFEFYNDEIMRLILEKFPLVLIDRQYRGHNISFVSTDHYKTTYNLVRTLHKNNRKNITMITTTSNRCSSEEDRISGFQQAILRYYGTIKEQNLLHITDYVDTELSKTFQNFLTKHPETDMFVVNSGKASTCLLQTVKAMNNTAVNFAFFDEESNDIIDLMNLNPYIIIQDSYNIGYNAASLLDRQIRNGFQTTKLQFPAEIVIYAQKYKISIK